MKKAYRRKDTPVAKQGTGPTQLVMPAIQGIGENEEEEDDEEEEEVEEEEQEPEVKKTTDSNVRDDPNVPAPPPPSSSPAVAPLLQQETHFVPASRFHDNTDKTMATVIDMKAEKNYEDKKSDSSQGREAGGDELERSLSCGISSDGGESGARGEEGGRGRGEREKGAPVKRFDSSLEDLDAHHVQMPDAEDQFHKKIFKEKTEEKKEEEEESQRRLPDTSQEKLTHYETGQGATTELVQSCHTEESLGDDKKEPTEEKISSISTPEQSNSNSNPLGSTDAPFSQARSTSITDNSLDFSHKPTSNDPPNQGTKDTNKVTSTVDANPACKGVRPKAVKVLLRKNTPAVLPKVDKLYANMSRLSTDKVLSEEVVEDED